MLFKSVTHAPPSSIADLKVVQSLRYLGVQIGHLTSEEAHAPVIQKMMGRARFLSNLGRKRQKSSRSGLNLWCSSRHVRTTPQPKYRDRSNWSSEWHWD